ncbi:hypothetical protein SAMN02800694_0574 [Luteibacter sp. UNCMF331Sha3.1]|uniref:hypothetical protein n=1 Tax=Luteibacter sp. UNCMF331Sha3.1 TaxID=1502760 RepID=UPI0008B1E357|nr:hypothetical protein [Luteibacter sp. UNCMF331Sha3.1]SEM30401.1 hypothetical protein SAMN02800694_0574 [Luteibacter sp. UNCMF331Sha3.1]
MPPAQLALPLALMIGAAIAATTTPSRSDIREIADAVRLAGSGHPAIAQLIEAHRAMRMLRISLRPGAALPWQSGNAPAAGYLVEGELHVQAPTGDLHVIRPGDRIAAEAGPSAHGVAGPLGATVVAFFAL